MTTQDDATRSNALVITRQEKLQTLRDDLATGERPAAIVPHTFSEVYSMCEALAKADLAPKHLRGKAMDMALVVMTGLEVGLPPMASLRLYTTWDGVPRLMAEGVRAIILQSPAIEYFEVATCDDTHATWVGKRRGRPEKSAIWTIERARKAGLLDKDNWKKYAQDMLNARASMQLGRIIAPDVVAGMVSREEAMDGDFIDVAEPKFTAPAIADTIGGVSAPARATAAARASRKPADQQNDPPQERSKLDAAVAKVEEKMVAERPTSAASASTSSPSASTSSPQPSTSTSPPVGGSTSTEAAAASSPTPSPSPTADPFQAAREAVETRDSWGQPIATEAASAEGTPQAEGFGAEEIADLGADGINRFEAWLAMCGNQREMAAGFPKWAAWAREMSDKHKDERFRTTGELAIRMKDSWARRKAQVPA